MVSSVSPPAQITLRFEPVSETLHGFSFMEFAKGRLILSDTKRIAWVDPKTGARGHIIETPTPHMFSSVHPATGEVVIENRNEPMPYGQTTSFSRVDVETHEITPVALNAEKLPKDIFFIGTDEEKVLCFGEHFERVSQSGDVLEVLKPGSIFTPLKQTAGFNTMPTANGLIFSNLTGIFLWPFGRGGSILLLAGSDSVAGQIDGVGRHARFRAMKKPVHDVNLLFTRDRPGGAKAPASRLARMDVRTDEVRTVHVEGFDFPSEFVTMALAGEELFVLARHGEEGQRILRASAHGDSGPTLARELQAVDLAQALQPATFKLAGGETLYFDRRLLVARSAYFRGMFASGCKESTHGEVDLSGDPSIGRAELEEVLRFVVSDAFEPADASPDHAFRVRALADQCHLPRLAALAEARLLEGLSIRNVLSYLGRVFGSDGALERACWRLLENEGETIVHESQCCIPVLIRENPELAEALIVRAKGFKPGSGGKRRRTS